MYNEMVAAKKQEPKSPMQAPPELEMTMRQ
jgi:hypothetical protein